MRRALAVVGLALLATAVPVSSAGEAATRHSPSGPSMRPVVGFPPAMRIVDIDGRAWTATDLRGRVVLVDFWATWCAPCLADLPRLQRLQARHGRDALTILGVSLDRSSVRDFRSWLQRQGIAWPQVREAAAFDGPLARAFGVEAIPATFLFDKAGRLDAAHLRGAALEARVRQLVEAR